MLSTNQTTAQTVEDYFPMLEVSGGIAHSKDGRGIGDLVDAKTIDSWVRDYLENRKEKDGLNEETLTVAFRFGVRVEGRFAGQSFIEAEPEIRSEWSSERGHLPWESVRDVVWEGFDRARDRVL